MIPNVPQTVYIVYIYKFQQDVTLPYLATQGDSFGRSHRSEGKTFGSRHVVAFQFQTVAVCRLDIHNVNFDTLTTDILDKNH